MTVLQFVRPKRRPAKFTPDPRRCHCTIQHPVTEAEQAVARARIARAVENGDDDTAGFLRLRLATAYRCPAWAGPKCPCGCGRTPGQHNPMNGDAA